MEKQLWKQGNITVLKQTRSLIQNLTPMQYADKPTSLQADSVGAHLRHSLDHYFLLLQGLESGRVDYDHRERDTRIATDNGFAILQIQNIIRDLEALPESSRDLPLQVKMDCGESSEWVGSSLARELQFLLSHHIHHNALIKLILESEGVRLDDEFGVAPSTLKFQKSS